MLEILNRYAHGLASVPILHALRERGCLAYLAEAPPASAEQLASEFSANRAYLDVAIRMLVSLDWVRPTTDGRYQATPGLASANVIPDRVMDLYRFPFDLYVRGEAVEALDPWFEISERRWNSDHPYLPDYLDGLLIVPLLLSLRVQGRLSIEEEKDAEATSATLRLNVDSTIRRMIEGLFVASGWGARSAGVLQLTRAGRFIIDRIPVTTMLASYRPMFGAAKKLLFGDAAGVFALDPGGHETHLDRTLNVIGSGFQHEKYFEVLSKMVIRCFDNEVYSSQPKYIADTGCGDGSLLLRLYETVRDRTRRGKVLDRHPLVLIAVDYNDKALAVAARTLQQVAHIALKGDIGDPLGLLHSLRTRGVEDLDRVLHVRSFLDHDRPYRQPEDRKAAEQRSRFGGGGIYIDAQGCAIPPHEMIQSTVEHLQRWSALVNEHGLIVLEAHCLSARVCAKYLDESESFHFDASQSLSHQCLLEAETFVVCAAEAGLFCPEGSWQRFPKSLPFTRITLNHFEKRPYSVRHAGDRDLPALLAMPKAWQSSAEPDRDTTVGFEARLRQFPEGQFVLQADGRILAFVCCDRERDNAVRLLSTYCLSAVPVSHLRGLLGLVEQYWTLKGDIGRMSGIEECRLAISTSAEGQTLARVVAADLAAKVTHYQFAAADDPRLGERELGRFSFRWLLANLQRMGAMHTAGETYDLDQLKRLLGIAPKYDRYFDALVRRLEVEELVIVDGRRVETTMLVSAYALTTVADQVAEFRESFPKRYPVCASLLNFTAACLSRFEDIVTGRVDVAEVVFPDAGMDLFADIFRGDAVSDYFNKVVAEAVCSAVRVGGEQAGQKRLAPPSKVRILEIGAGTGGTTGAVLEAAEASAGAVEFCLTDVSPSMMRHAQRRFAGKYPWIDYRTLDIESDISKQSFTAHHYDVIIATNVLHDTRNVDFALKQVRKLLKPGGLFILNEYTSVKDCLLFSGALLHGYWLFEDPDKRLRDSCLLGVSQWIKALERTGFAVTGSHALPTQVLDAACTQCVLLCEAKGTEQTPAAPAHRQASEVTGGNTGLRKAEIVGKLVKEQVLTLLGRERAAAYSPHRPLMDIGLDSIELVELKSLMKERLGVKLSPAFLFEHETPEKMAAALSDLVSDQQIEGLLPPGAGGTVGGCQQPAGKTAAVVTGAGKGDDAIAIVGVACRLPGGVTSAQSFWTLLESGRHGIISMPTGRWRWPAFIDLRGQHKGIDQAGFLERIDEFDAPFFRTSPREAELMDPQQRLLLELSWEAMEDAGHPPSELSGRMIGVFVGVCHGDYREVLTSASDSPDAYVGTGSAHSLLANRVSYFHDFKGPSLTVDTACSSSLFALHDAVNAIRRGDCEQALVGAANLMCSPTNSISYYRAGMLFPTGRCRTFDQGANGYVRGEGGAMLLLKPLAMALAEGDSIYGLVKGTAVNHGGQAASLTAPKPGAQAAVIEAAWRVADVPLESVGYIETHGTGTSLGDPIEVGGLIEAFRRLYRARGEDLPCEPHCGLGSAKTNLGHLEGAAGLAGLVKLLMAIEHRLIPATLNFERLNPEIDLTGSPFFIADRNHSWSPRRDKRGGSLPRRAGVSSFGFGGSNAHAVIEEYPSPQGGVRTDGPCLVPLSARDDERLVDQARRLLELLESGMGSAAIAGAQLAEVAYTLQVGREPMEERVAFIVQSREELMAALRAYIAADRTIPNCHRGHSESRRYQAGTLPELKQSQEIEVRTASRDDLAKLASLWVTGVEIDWTRLHAPGARRRLHLPPYPFARERYWISPPAASTPGAGRPSHLHPLVQHNTSNLSEQRYSSTFTGEEFFLADHQVAANGHASQKVLPGVAYLEMARVAVERAIARSGENLKAEGWTIGTSNLAWLRPLLVGEKPIQVHVRLSPEGDDEIDFEIYSAGNGPDVELEIVHCQGRMLWSRHPVPARIDLNGLRAQMVHGRLEPGEVYDACAFMGLIYGPAFQAITAIHQGSGQVLAQLRLPSAAAETLGDYVLHPSLMDGALQAALGLMEGFPKSPQPRLPFALQTLRVVSPCTREMFAWVRYSPGSQVTDTVVKVDIDLCDEQGKVCVQMHGFSSRVSGQEIGTAATQDRAAGALLATPVWQASMEVPAVGSQTAYVEHHVVLCELGQARAERLESLLGRSQLLSLEAGPGKSIADRYSEYALGCFERIRTILQGKPLGKVLVQIVVAGHEEQALLAGLSGLLKTAGLENPQLIGQIILVPAEMTTEELGRRLQQEKAQTPETLSKDTLIRYEQGVRQVSRWQEVPAEAQKPAMVFQDQGVYLITGGLGGLGVLFAQEILGQTSQGRVVLTGRTAWSAEKQARLEGLSKGSEQASRLSYRQVDLGDLDQVRQLIAGILQQHGQLNGILHCAGMIADNFLLKKSSVEFSQVLAPKVAGAYNLDQASQEVELDFLVLFSSVAGALGNVGQSDYAAANGFLDQFALYRNGQAGRGQRRGRTRSINWPLWQAGGMKIDAVSQELLEQATGIRPMQTAIGMESFYRSLALPYAQMLVVEGDLAQIRRVLLDAPVAPCEPQMEPPAAISEMDAESLAERTQSYLRKQFSELLKLASHKIDTQARMEQYGMDSILAISLTNQLEKTFGSLSKTLFFEYQTISELSQYFIQAHAARLATLFTTIENSPGVLERSTRPGTQPQAEVTPSRRFSRPRSSPVSVATNADADEIAIIGLSGRYPEAINIDAYWSNLRQGKDCIVEVPRERWDWREYFSDDRSRSGHHFSKWGGFIAGVDEFDPLFFNISPKEAKHIDPQERLFLQHAWMAVEDAGYTRASLQMPSAGQGLAGQVGVYVGLMYSEYQLFGAEASMRGNRQGIAGTTASIANRVSYVLNLHGPSMTLDTMCSSSLTAIHIACQDLKQGRTNLAIAGGVNVSIHPNKYLLLSAGQFISSEGHCQSFGEGGDGYIPGEGVGVVVLKRLSEAKRDGDHIYGMIRGSALTHGGKTNGYTVPNPQAQSDAISRALVEARLDARHISYIEAHGTGTRLGDPIEIAALGKAFQPYTADTGFCLIGSAKSNIGHCESAAGIAGLTKVLLQMQHGEIVPSLHSAELNPHIDFSSTPFVVNQQLRAWEAPVLEGRTLARIAGISSFGAGGSNAHLIVEEYPSPIAMGGHDGKVVLLLSARTPEQLKQKAVDLLEFIRARQSTMDLAAMAYTLQVGREAMEERLSLVASSVGQVVEKLTAYVEGEREIEDLYLGQVKPNHEALSLFRIDADLQHAVDKWIVGGKLARLSDMWVKGLDLDWSKLYGEFKPQRISLPTYPFARERYWIDTSARDQPAKGAITTVLHPLLHSNISDLSEQRYSSTFTGEEFFLADHQLKADGRTAQKVLPGVAYLEMARAAIGQALPGRPGVLELHDTVWSRPIVVNEKKQVSIALLARDGGEIDYEIYSQDSGQEIIHCQGRAVWSPQPIPARLDLGRLQAEIQADEVLAQLRLPSGFEDTLADYVLHPSVMDGALQAAVGLMEGSAQSAQPRLLAALETLRIISPCSREMFAWVRYRSGSTDKVVKLDIDLCDEQGNVAVQLRGVCCQAAFAEDKEITLAAEVRKEIALVAYDQPAQVEQKKPTGISLVAPGTLAEVSAENAVQRLPVTLSSTQGSAAAACSVRLFNYGNGIFAIHAGAPAGRDEAMVTDLLQALGRVQQEASVKVLMLSGIERFFLHSGREAYNEAVGQGLYQAMVSFPYPVIAVVTGDAIGASFLSAALCDFMVCSEEARYGYVDPQRHFYPTMREAILFGERFGPAPSQDFLYMSATAWTGRQLRTKGWTCPIVPEGGVEAYAEQLASSLATKSQAALRLLKKHLTRRLAGLVQQLTPVEATAPAIEMRSEVIVSPSQHIHLDSPAENVLVIRFQVTELKDLVAMFARIGQHRGYKAIVLVSEGFLPAPSAEDRVLELRHLLMELEIPVIAALAGNAAGQAWLISQFCDACVYSRTGVYSSAGMGHSQAVAQTAAALFTHRFGHDAGKEILLTEADYSGDELRQRAAAVLVAEHDWVLPAAIKVAEFWATLPRAILAGWKQHTAAMIEETMRSLPAWEQGDEAPVVAAGAPGSIALQSTVVTVTAHPDGVVVVKMEDRQAKNMFSDAWMDGVKEAFAHIERTGSYKVVVLTGYDSYFASGGTRESLLAIQAGKAKFTDNKIFQVGLDCKLPVIAAMQGHGIGAGWSLGMFSDLVLLSEESRYVSPYMNYGFTPGAGATLILGDKIGHDLARESLLTGQLYAGSELKARGLRLAIVPRAELLPAAMRLAGQIAHQPRSRLIGLKQQWSQSLHQALPETYQLELAMHEKTFVGHPDTLLQIQSKFYQQLDEPAVVPQPMRAQALKPSVAPASANDSDGLPEVTASLKTLLANELQMQASDIDEHVQLVDLGLDSISGVTWVRKINQKYEIAIEATKIYSYPTLSQLSCYVREQAELHGTLSHPSTPAAAGVPVASSKGISLPNQQAPEKLTSWRSRTASRFTSAPATQPAPPSQAIAVIGMAGQFPQARNLEEFWQNIAQGRNCITPISTERWDVNAYYEPGAAVAGKSNSQWLGALEQYDRFDPLFFNISPTEAESMDPQQRLFLEACWHSIEDAGYDARVLSGTKCGVFVGCAAGDYQQLSRSHQLSAQGFTGSAMSILAARISYFLNLQGPCVSIDTACSSSLVALAQGCDSLVSGGSDLALAGGVYVMAGPEMHIRTSQAGMLSSEGRCFSFDQRADGFVPGEGVGVVLLKRLADAQKDRDIIYAVIRGWGVNQDGKTNGITAPNPESQTRLEQQVYDKYQIDPANLQLIEAHGTGTKLGDPIEVEGLKEAFQRYTQAQQYCALGSVKSNIGHCLTAAGIAGFIKLVLALRHQQLPPTINFEQLNEHINLKDSPFYINRQLQQWPLAGNGIRQAAVSAFGFSGTNAHVVIGEYVAPAAVDRPVSVLMQKGKMIIPLSARTSEQLKQKAKDLCGFLGKQGSSIDLMGIAYTLQVGRQAMEERLGLMVNSTAQLVEKLEAYLEGRQGMEDLYRGQVKRGQESISILSQDDEVKETIVDRWLAAGKLSKLLELWVKGLDLDWNKLYGEIKPQRIPLPMYPFAKERYWIENRAAEQPATTPTAVLHPLLHTNTSDLRQQSYSATFTGQEFFLKDHHVDGHSILPAAVYLEMARVAIKHALPAPPEMQDSMVLELRDTVWLQPLVVTGHKQISIALFANDDEQVGYEISGIEAEQKIIYCEGHALFSKQFAPASRDIARLKSKMKLARLEPSYIYATFASMGLNYGPAHQGITALYVGEKQLLAQLRLPAVVAPSSHQYVLHPSLIDGALQASIGLMSDFDRLSTKPFVPFVLESLRVLSACTTEMVAWVRCSDGTKPKDVGMKVNIDLCDQQGNVCVQILGFSSRVLQSEVKSTILPVKWNSHGRLTAVEDGPAFDSVFYRDLIAELVNHDISLDEAVELG